MHFAVAFPNPRALSLTIAFTWLPNAYPSRLRSGESHPRFKDLSTRVALDPSHQTTMTGGKN